MYTIYYKCVGESEMWYMLHIKNHNNTAAIVVSHNSDFFHHKRLISLEKCYNHVNCECVKFEMTACHSIN